MIAKVGFSPRLARVDRRPGVPDGSQGRRAVVQTAGNAAREETPLHDFLAVHSSLHRAANPAGRRRRVEAAGRGERGLRGRAARRRGDGEQAVPRDLDVRVDGPGKPDREHFQSGRGRKQPHHEDDRRVRRSWKWKRGKE